MFDEFDRVRIKLTGVVGTIVDKVVKDGKAEYVVESDTYENSNGKPYSGEWALFDCVDMDLERA